MPWKTELLPPATPPKKLVQWLFPRNSVIMHSVRGRTHYLNVDGRAKVVLARFNPKAAQWHHLIMDESELPFHFEPGERFLDTLDPPGSENAAEWRSRCHMVNFLRRLDMPVKIKLETPLSFGNYGSYDTFQRDGRRWWAVGADFDTTLPAKALATATVVN